MFLGHYGLAFAAKRVVPRTSLGTLTFAAQLLDELWPLLLLIGVEQVRIVPGLMKTSPFDFVSYPFSHSLLTSILWGVIVGGAHYAQRRDRRAAILLAALVVSHWFLDLLVHRPDLPLWPGRSPLLGAGLWNSMAATLVLELGIFGGGLAIYLGRTRARDRTGRWALWTMVALLLLIFLGGLGGAPPPSPRAVAVVTLGLWLFVPWAAWADRHRELVASRSRESSERQPLPGQG